MPSKRRFLLVTLDAAGNWPPELVLIRALAQRGHHVRVVSNASHAAQITAAGAEYRAYRYAPERDPASRRDTQQESEFARIVREVFLNRTYCHDLLSEVDRFTPDVLLVDQMLLTAAAAAESTGLPTATLWHTVFGARADNVPQMDGRALDPLNTLRQEIGLAPVADWWASRVRSQAILAFTYAEFDWSTRDLPAQLHYVGPLACVPQPSAPHYSLPWARHDARPLILVSYSTSFQDQVSALQRVADAVAVLPARVLMTLGNAISEHEMQLPGNVVAEPFVPHAAVLPQARLVVTHAGHGTVMAAVTAGVPLVCMPMGRDQFAVSSCVDRRRIGIVVPVTAPPQELRRVIAGALADDALRERARSFAAGLDVASGLQRAIVVLENLRASSA